MIRVGVVGHQGYGGLADVLATLHRLAPALDHSIRAPFHRACFIADRHALICGAYVIDAVGLSAG